MMRASLSRMLVAAIGALTFSVGGPAREVDDAGDRRILVMLGLPPPHFKPGSAYAGSYGDAPSAAARRRIARQIARDHQLKLEESWPMPLLGVDCFVMQVPVGTTLADAVSSVSRSRGVEWAQPMQTFESQGTDARGDPLLRAAPAATQWRLADLHKVATGRGSRIAVIDSKIDVKHPDLAGQFSADRDFVREAARVPEHHGTAVAGVIAAKAGNGVGTAGIAPGARLMALRACWQTAAGGPTACDSLSLARALLFAIEHGASVINLSLSGPHDQLLQRLIAIAIARRASVVAAYNPKLPRGGFPASQSGVIAVADETLRPLPPMLYAAPGRNVPTARPGGRWTVVTGSSYAAAHVSGLVALVRERRCSDSRPIAIARLASGAVDACTTLLRAPGCDSARRARPGACA